MDSVGKVPKIDAALAQYATLDEKVGGTGDGKALVEIAIKSIANVNRKKEPGWEFTAKKCCLMAKELGYSQAESVLFQVRKIIAQREDKVLGGTGNGEGLYIRAL
ncbi:MAG: hypothetical protein SP4CHLAM5_03600 [Chlamydiia bacterium]|nr:hypothetical protein [Chlamydiia bacterium]MCH9618234.1 hypothetical protein [Chlamydiia bacterium]MCH9624465.1 hypothetical protein [Chlamydiia bacterium]